MSESDDIVIYSFGDIDISFGLHGLDPRPAESTHTDYNLHNNNSNLPSQHRRDLGTRSITNHHLPETAQLT